MKLSIEKCDVKSSFDDLPHQLILFVDTRRHIAAHAIKGPDHRYCAYIECPEQLSHIVGEMIPISWPITGHGCCNYLPAHVPNAFNDTVVVGWDYDHMGFPKNCFEWNNLKDVMNDCTDIYNRIIAQSNKTVTNTSSN